MVLDNQYEWRKEALEKSLLRDSSFPNEYKMLVLAGAAYLIVNGAIIFLKDVPKTEIGPERTQITELAQILSTQKDSIFFHEKAYVPETAAKVDSRNQPNLTPLSYQDLEKILEQKEMTILEKAENLGKKTAISESSRPEMHPKVKKSYDIYKKQGGYMKMIRKIDSDFGDLISKASEKYQIPESLLYGIIIAESGGDYKLRSKTSSAKGLMQILDGTAKGLECGNRFNPREALDCGTKYLRQIRSRYQEMSPELSKEDLNYFMVAGYNQGPNGELKRDVKRKASFWDKKYDATGYVRKIMALQQLVLDYQAEKRETDLSLN